MDTPEGKKLTIGTKTLNALITSSLRIDSLHLASVGGTVVNFDLPTNRAITTGIFLDVESIGKANAIALDPHANKVQRFDIFDQLRQIRSLFRYPSTYTLCRASSDLTNDLLTRPATIFTYADADSGEHDSAGKIASRLFQEVARNVMRSSGLRPTITKQSLLELVNKCPDTQMKTTLNEIASTDENEIPIMGNKILDRGLQKLAELLSHQIAAQNKIVGQVIQARFREKMES